MKCKKCNGIDIKITILPSTSNTLTTHVSIINNIVRIVMIILTCGLWVLVPKQKQYAKTKYKNQKHIVCQTCGFVWKF